MKYIFAHFFEDDHIVFVDGDKDDILAYYGDKDGFEIDEVID